MQLIRVVTRYEVAETHFDVFRCYRQPPTKMHSEQRLYFTNGYMSKRFTLLPSSIIS